MGARSMPPAGLASRRLRLVPPDYADKRGGNVLLVWKDIPHWLVVDAELHELLAMFADAATPAEVIARRPTWQS